MSKKDKKILVVGGGGIGGITAFYLQKASYDVTIYDVDKDHVDTINKDGLTVDGVRGKKHVKINASTSLDGTYDVVFLAVKSINTSQALKSIQHHLKKNSVVVSLQNGINEETIANTIGEQRTIGCMVGWGATNHGPGHLEHTSEGKFIIGRLDGTIDNDLEDVKRMLEKVTETKITQNIFGHLWSKLLINCCIATIGVCFGADVKKLVTNQKIIPIMVALTDELVRISEYADVKLEKFEDVLDIGLFRINDMNDYKRAVAIMKMAADQHKEIKSSMWQDIEKGRKTEIDYINGYVEEKAKELGIASPINQALIRLVKDIEKKKKKPSMKNIDSFYETVRIPKLWIDYDFDQDPLHELAIYNLPCSYKLQNASKISSLQFIGLTTAFSKAFERLTKSLIGKIFIRKTAWEIVNIVLSKYLQTIGGKFALNVKTNYNLEENDTDTILKIICFFLNVQHIEFIIEEYGKKRCILLVNSNNDSYLEAEKTINVEDKIEIPIIIQLMKAISTEINNTIQFTYEFVSINGDHGYRINLSK